MKRGYAVNHALRGIKRTFAEERNFKIHVSLATLAFILGCWLQLSWAEWLWILLAIALVSGMELINTAIENFLDLVSPGYHPLARKAKDAAAGAVLVAALFALIVGGVIFGPKLWNVIFR